MSDPAGSAIQLTLDRIAAALETIADRMPTRPRTVAQLGQAGRPDRLAVMLSAETARVAELTTERDALLARAKEAETTMLLAVRRADDAEALLDPGHAPDDGPTILQIVESIESAQRARQREADDLPCPNCGGDRLRTDFTGSGRCHAPRAQP